ALLRHELPRDLLVEARVVDRLTPRRVPVVAPRVPDRDGRVGERRLDHGLPGRGAAHLDGAREEDAARALCDAEGQRRLEDEGHAGSIARVVPEVGGPSTGGFEDLVSTGGFEDLVWSGPDPIRHFQPRTTYCALTHISGTLRA